MKHHSLHHEQGSALIITMMLFVMIALSVSIGLIAPTVSAVRSANDSIESKRSYAIAESGVEDVFYRVRTAKQVSSTETLISGDQEVQTVITDLLGGEKQITSTGDSSNRNRIITAVIEQGAGVSFTYGMQSGYGGITMANNSQVNGSVYSNGQITGSGVVTGSATSANASSAYTDQQNGSGTPSNDIVFGNTNATQDIAQSFQVSVTEPVNKFQFYLKKVSTPSNLTVRIVNNSGGSPGTTTLASGTLSASSVSTSYSWVDVTLSSSPQLVAGTTYWVVLDGSTNATRYYTIGGNTGYTSGTGKIGQYSGSWNNTSPSGLDLFFRLYLGGAQGLISGITVGSGGVGNAYAHTVNNSTIAGTNYCQVGSGNNKTCNTSLADPVAVDMPISEANMQDWKDAALEGGVHSGNYILDGTTGSIGPKKIQGDLMVQNNATLTVSGTLWVTGNINISNNATVRLTSSYGSGSGVIIADGTVSIGNNVSFNGSGTSGSYIMVVTTSSSTSAINLQNNAGAVVLYAANGTVNVANNAGAASINGYQINLSNNAVITYQTGLANANFVNGPSGSWSATSWREQ
jgi:Tfp pilus assembly protein PilX